MEVEILLFSFFLKGLELFSLRLDNERVFPLLVDTSAVVDEKCNGLRQIIFYSINFNLTDL